MNYRGTVPNIIITLRRWKLLAQIFHSQAGEMKNPYYRNVVVA